MAKTSVRLNNKTPINVRVTPLELEKLHELRETKGMTMSEVLRLGMWKIFDELLDNNNSTVEYKIEAVVERILKEKGL